MAKVVLRPSRSDEDAQKKRPRMLNSDREADEARGDGGDGFMLVGR